MVYVCDDVIIIIITFIAVIHRAYAYTLVDKHVQQNGQMYKASIKSYSCNNFIERARAYYVHLRAWYIIVAAVLEHVKLIVAAASTRGNTVIDFRFVDRGYNALEAESALVQHSTCSWLDNQCATVVLHIPRLW